MEVNMIKAVRILGTEYKVYTKVPLSKDSELIGRFGYVSYGDHRIVIADLNTIEDWRNESEEVKQSQEKTTLRHEIIHAFIAESGLRGSSLDVSHWALNEEMVDWFALQLPKMLSVFELLDCTGVV
jgi:hypothetical protein